MRNPELGSEDPQEQTTGQSQEVAQSETSAEKKYRVMTPENIESYKEFAKAKIQLWHDKVDPKYVFLTETSSVPFGWLFKETWKAMYPGEEVPKFYRIEAHKNENMLYNMLRHFHENKEDWDKEKGRHTTFKKYIQSRIKDKEAPVIVYDETERNPELEEGQAWDRKGGSLKRADDPEASSLRNEALEKARTLLGEFGDLKNLWTDQGIPDQKGKYGGKIYLGDYVRISPEEKEEILIKRGGYTKPGQFFEEIGIPAAEYDKQGLPSDTDQAFRRAQDLAEQEKRSGPIYVKPTRKSKTIKGGNIKGEQKFTGSTEKDPELRKRALDYIHDLKLVGKEAGEELRAELEKQKEVKN